MTSDCVVKDLSKVRLDEVGTETVALSAHWNTYDVTMHSTVEVRTPGWCADHSRAVRPRPPQPCLRVLSC